MSAAMSKSTSQTASGAGAGADKSKDLEHNTQQHPKPCRRSAWRALVQDFGPQWLPWSMNAGILGILMHELPYQFSGLPVLSTTAFLIDLILFAAATSLLLLRFAMFRKQAFDELTDTGTSLSFLSCWPIAWLTLTAFVALNVSTVSWATPAWSVLAYVMWWIGAAWMIATLLFTFTLLITYPRDPTELQLPPLIIIPAVGTSTVGVLGAIIAIYPPAITPSMAIPVMIFSFCSVGVGFLMGMFLYSHLFHELMVKTWYTREHSAYTFLFVGPMGQSAAALQLLGSAANTYGRFAATNEGTFLTRVAALPLDVICTLLALLMTGMGAIWMLLAFCGMAYRASRRELAWDPTWNVIIFPTGTLVTSCILLGNELDSAFFRVVSAVALLFLVIVFLINAVMTVLRISQGRLLIVRDDPRVPKDDDKEQ